MVSPARFHDQSLEICEIHDILIKLTIIVLAAEILHQLCLEAHLGSQRLALEAIYPMSLFGKN